MNVNLLTIDALSATSLQPLTRMADKANEGGSQLVQGSADSKPGLACGESRGGQDESVLTTASASGADKSQSDNITTDTQDTGPKPLKLVFGNVLKRRLASDESGDESGDGEVTPESQKPVTDDKAEQVVTVFPGDVVVPAQQQQPVVDNEATSNQPTQPVSGALTGTDNLSSTGTQAAGDNIGDVQPSVPQQIQATSAGDSQTVPSTAAQVMDVQQGQQQSEASPNTDTGQAAGNSVAASPPSADNTVKTSENQPQDGSGKSVESANQNNTVDTESIDLPNQSGAVQSETAALSAVTVTGSKDTKQLESTTAGGRPGRESTSSGRIKDKVDGDQQKGSLDLSKTTTDSEQNNSQLAEKLNVESIDLVSDKNSTPKSESGNGASQTAVGQVSTLDVAQVAAGSRSAVADLGAATTANSSSSDTAAAIREQICQSVAASIQQGNSQITIHLNPPELGRVSVKFSQLGNVLTGHLEATNPQTRAEIQQSIPDIIRSLEQSGISVKSIDVTLSDSSRQQPQESLRDNSSQDLWQQFGNQNFQNTGQNQSSPDSFVTPTYSDNGSVVGNDASSSRNQSSPSNMSDNLLDVLI